MFRAKYSESMVDDTSFCFKDGQKSVFVSAPHNAQHVRKGVMKCSEPGTGPLALFLNEKLDCPCLVKVIDDGTDPNYDAISDYREFLIKKIFEKDTKIVLDIHQMSPERSEMICIGAGFGKNIQNRFDLVDVIRECFTDGEIYPVLIDDPFPASYEHTISRTISRECNIPAIQIEINTQLFSTELLKQKIYNTLYDVVKRIEEVI